MDLRRPDVMKTPWQKTSIIGRDDESGRFCRFFFVATLAAGFGPVFTVAAVLCGAAAALSPLANGPGRKRAATWDEREEGPADPPALPDHVLDLPPQGVRDRIDVVGGVRVFGDDPLQFGLGLGRGLELAFHPDIPAFERRH
jgi:hypothetical protein